MVCLMEPGKVIENGEKKIGWTFEMMSGSEKLKICGMMLTYHRDASL